jgi:hypothetical protein
LFVCFRLLTLKAITIEYGYPPPPLAIGIIGLGGNYRQIFEFKGVIGKVFINQGVRLSKSAENRFGAASRAVLGGGIPFTAPIRSLLLRKAD